ncbi:hypothetical protein SEA_OCTOBIEN14_31 [Gordonia phage Octobien14]|uniref:Uncharacterized protein n=1 Tax=Gordonia phage Octobien14 TaxID=2483673 RepID=A0A3G3MA91_9CAUD|nr:hypothetical protein L3Y22_gp031 [Gordonia phage Octobien14]AYR03179.1 hypothetical protein SEA_OCTOBIEN14_31 [Gordonia phage Octobien14]
MANSTSFTLPDLPDVTFEVSRGATADPYSSSNTITIIGTKPGIATEDNPSPDRLVVIELAFAGP